MDLIIYQVMELQVIHVAHGHRVIKLFACTAVGQGSLTILTQAGQFQALTTVVLMGTVKYGGHHLPAQCHSGIAQMHLQHLPDVHTRRYAQGVQYNIQRATVRQERHILLGQYPGHNALVTVTTGHLITGLDLTLLGDINANHFVHAGAHFVAVGTGEHLNIHHNTILAVGHTHGGVTHLAGLLTEDGTQQPLLCGQLCLALGGHFTHQNIAAVYLGADADNTVLVQILPRVLATSCSSM